MIYSITNLRNIHPSRIEEGYHFHLRYSQLLLPGLGHLHRRQPPASDPM